MKDYEFVSLPICPGASLSDAEQERILTYQWQPG